MEARCIRLVHN